MPSKATNQFSEPEIAVSFRDFLLKNPFNRRVLWISGIALVIQFAILKYYYPFASYIHGDSFVYIHSAIENLSINTYMIGYSMFLRLFSVFSASDTVLTAFQYLFIEAGTFFFLFTIFYFYSPGKWAKLILISFVVINPLFLFLANMISSDPYFLALSLIWVTLLLWIIHKPGYKIALWHAIVLFIAFTVRYNGLIYFFISVMAFSLSTWPLQRKILSISLASLLIGIFILNTASHYKKLTGYWQYSPFAGWQMTNNAMYAYRYVDSVDRKPVPPRFQQLDVRIRQHFDSTRDFKKYVIESIKASTVYMWSPHSPLYVYRNTLFKNDTSASELKKWASMGPLYNAYGWYLIKAYPSYYFQYYIWPNANKYYAPPLEFLSSYNSGKNTVDQGTQFWFRYDSIKVFTRTKDLQIHMLDYFPILSGAINLTMLIGLIFYFTLTGFALKTRFDKGILLAASVWLLNAVFTIFASSAALRFQSFPIILTTVSVCMIVDRIINLAFSPQHKLTTRESGTRYAVQ